MTNVIPSCRGESPKSCDLETFHNGPEFKGEFSDWILD